MSDLKYILKIKRKLKGEEAGRAVLKDLAYSNKPVMNGTGERKELFSMAEKAFIQDNILNDPYETNMYNRYVHLCNAIVDTTKSVAVNHLSYLYATTHLNLIMIRLSQDSILQSDTPYVMTETEYEEVRKRHLEESLKDEDGKYYWYNLFTILGRAFYYYKHETPDKEPEYEHIYAVMRKYDEEPCKDEYLISQYNRVYKVGYYVKPDGTKVPRGDMLREVMDILIAKNDKALGVDGLPMTEGAKQISFVENRAMIEQAVQEEKKLGDTFTLEKETKPFTLYDILDEAEEFYPNLYQDNKEGEKERKHFMTAFKDLIDEVIKQIDKDYFRGDITKHLKDGDSPQDIVYRADDLQDIGFPHILIHTEAELMGWNEPYATRVENAGIAVLRCSGKNNSVKFKNAELMNNPLKMLTKLLLNEIDNQKEDWIPMVERGLYFLQGYNKGLELIAEYTGVKEVVDLKREADLGNIEAYNTAYYLALHHLDDEGREKIIENFRPIRTNFKIPEERINKARSLLVGLDGFKDRVGNYEFFDTLTTYIPEEHQ